MSNTLSSTEDLSNTDAISTDEPPRKYIRRNDDISIGVTTRSRQREQDKTKKESESTPTDQLTSDMLNTSSIEQCAICMETFSNQEVGIPENCEHSFCLACIIAWAKKNNSCPIDRKVFRQVFKKHSYHCQKPYDSMKVEDNRLEVQLEENFLEMIDDDISCRVCGRDDQEDLLLICDECGNGYHTFCLELPGVPDTPEWMCPLCEVDQMSATEDLYEDSDLEELQHILFDDSLNTTETDNEVTDAIGAVRQPRLRQTARMRTGGVRNQRTATGPNTRSRRRQRQPRQRRAPTTRRLTLVEQQRQRHRRQRRVLTTVNRRIENVNTRTREANAQNNSNRQDAPRLSIYNSEPIGLEDELSTTSSSTTTATPILTSNRSIITPNEAARRIAASGIPILARSETEPSISRTLSITRTIPTLDRVPTRTIRPSPAPPRIPINQLPRIQRRHDAPPRPRPIPPSRTSSAASSMTASFLDNLLNSQERLHNLQNVRIHGPHIQIS